jgi:hypothetical protein
MENQAFISENLSSSGITVSTVNPIYVGTSRKSYDDYYLNLDANSPSAEVSAFQEWLNKNYKGWATGYSGGIVVPVNSGYGKFGGLTQAAWSKYGNQYLASLPPTNTSTTTQENKDIPKDKLKEAEESTLLQKALALFGGIAGKVETGGSSTTKKQKKDGDGNKMSLGVKIAIGVGALMLVGGVIYAVTKKNK